MTDNEIINQWKHERELAECVCSYFVDQVELSLVNETIDLINRQKAEIEKLNKKVKELLEVKPKAYKDYLIIVSYALTGLVIYKVKTDNIYRIIGKFYSTSIERIDRIDYSRYTPEKSAFWEKEGYKIRDYKERILSEEKGD